MPKFQTSNLYQPENYTFDDFLRYRYLKGGLVQSGQAVAAARVSSIKAPSISLKEKQAQILGVYEQRLRDLALSIYAEPIINNAMIFARGVLGFPPTIGLEDFREWIQAYRKTLESSELYTDFLNLLDELVNMVAFMQDEERVSSEWYRDPDEFAPRNKSLQNLGQAWHFFTGQHSAHIYILGEQERRRLFEDTGSRHGLVQGVIDAHIANVNMVLAPNYESCCEQEFSMRTTSTASNDSKIAAGSRNGYAARSNPGFLLAIYQDPRFQHGYTQLLLLAIIIMAALIAATFMVNVAALPVAVASVVTGLSKLAANMIFGSAVTVAAGATVALAASLHARFFSKPDDLGRGGCANVTSSSSGSYNPQM